MAISLAEEKKEEVKDLDTAAGGWGWPSGWAVSYVHHHQHHGWGE